MEESENHVAVPSRHDLDLGIREVLSFAREELPREWDPVSDMFHRKEAYGRFKRWLDACGKLDAWHAFEQRATEEALRDWCRTNGFVAVEKEDRPPPA